MIMLKSRVSLIKQPYFDHFDERVQKAEAKNKLIENTYLEEWLKNKRVLQIAFRHQIGWLKLVENKVFEDGGCYQRKRK